MARILQIRRGTTAQNDKFTGMPGEVTFDTDAKTLRVHDGVKLGGYALSRADGTSTGGTTGGNGGCNCPADGNGDTNTTFDIASVSDEFWTALFERFAPESGGCDCGNAPGNAGTGIGVLDGLMAPLTISDGIKITSEEKITPYFAQLYLVCRTAEAGYAAGDVCTAFGAGDIYAIPTNISTTDTGFQIIAYTQNKSFWVMHKDTAQKTDISVSKWRLYARVYY